jgi:hypothetical protein
VGSAAEIAAWGEVSVYAHRADASVIRGERAGSPPTLADWERALFDQVRTQLPQDHPVPVEVDHEVDDADVLDLGGVRAVARIPGSRPGAGPHSCWSRYGPVRTRARTGSQVARSRGQPP